ncbi:MAG: zinc-ribbon and DUF3426 domain-containing protein [Hyphomonadaceae bacterium]|nr:zinc-ribbon and DUF3426 domain-containing protein [Hyphomonadaceae bacterium]
MILTCESCSSRYYAGDDSIGSGRMVRCAACGHEWFAEPSLLLATKAPSGPAQGGRGGGAAAVASPQPTTAAVIRARHAQRVLRRQRLHALGAGGAALLLLAGLIGGAALGRNSLAAVWPKSASVFERLGLEVNATSLVIEALEVAPAPGPTPDVALVRGVIRNTGRRQAQARPVRLELLSAEGRRLSSANAQPSAPVLKPFSVTRFEARFEKPPPEARFLAAQFAPQGQGAAAPEGGPAAH